MRLVGSAPHFAHGRTTVAIATIGLSLVGLAAILQTGLPFSVLPSGLLLLYSMHIYALEFFTEFGLVTTLLCVALAEAIPRIPNFGGARWLRCAPAALFVGLIVIGMTHLGAYTGLRPQQRNLVSLAVFYQTQGYTSIASATVEPTATSSFAVKNIAYYYFAASWAVDERNLPLLAEAAAHLLVAGARSHSAADIADAGAYLSDVAALNNRLLGEALAGLSTSARSRAELFTSGDLHSLMSLCSGTKGVVEGLSAPAACRLGLTFLARSAGLADPT